MSFTARNIDACSHFVDAQLDLRTGKLERVQSFSDSGCHLRQEKVSPKINFGMLDVI